jgi:antitoxin (DNA-binding transcriptional repressor) of toxin-antitoxin stability system
VDDVRFWRGAAVAADAFGGPAWIRPAPGAPGAECVRLGETPWVEVARALEDMMAAEAVQYSGHAQELRERLLETLAELARGPEVCGCLRGDAAAGLAALAAPEPEDRRGTPAQRALAKAAGDALAALQSGRVRPRWLRETPDGPATGCGPPR